MRISKCSFLLILVVVYITGCSGNGEDDRKEAVVYTNLYQDKLFRGVAKEEWAFKGKDNEVFGQVLTTDKNTYFSSAEKIYVVDTATGEEKWNHSVNGQASVPAIFSDMLLYTDSSGMHAVKEGTGEGIWDYDFSSELPFPSRYPTAVASTSHVFITDLTLEGPTAFKALDIHSGKEAWTLAGDLSLILAPTVIKDKLYIPAAGEMLVVNEKDGKEIHSFNTKGILNSYAMSDQQIVGINISGNVTSYDANTGKLLWEYDNELLGLPNTPDITILKNKILLTEKKSGSIIALDSKSGGEVWSKQYGDEKNSTVMAAAITAPSVIENTLYIGIFDGQDEQFDYLPGYSNLTAINEETGEELWHHPVDEYIMYPPTFVDGHVIVTNMKQTVTSYQGGESAKKEDPTVVDEQIIEENHSTATDDEIMAKNSDGLFDLQAYEGNWSTPGSDEMAFNLSFTDSTTGIITFYSQGSEDSQPFQYVYPGGTLMAKIGNEEKPTILTLSDSGVLVYRDNEHRYQLERSNAEVEEGQEGQLHISGFQGKWCDTLQALCFDLQLAGDSGGTLDYYQEREPIKESFVITYADEYSMVIEVDESEQVTLDLDVSKNTLTYGSDTMNEVMIKQ